jgi:single-stranded DNA-specific DHH superfamily exonuclease
VKRLKKKLNKFFKKGISFLEQIKPLDKVILIYHNDVDGVVSAAICSIALKKLGIKISKILAKGIEEINKNLTHIIKIFDFAIILDIPMEKIKISKNILIIDHHPTKNLNNKKIVHINPRFINPETYQPVSYVVYKFLGKFLNIKNLEWLAVLGTVGDYGFKDCKDLLKKWIKVKKKNELWKNEFGKAVDSINSASYFLGFEKTLRILVNSKNLLDFSKNKEIIIAKKKYRKILEDAEKDFWKNAQKIKNFLIYSELNKKYKELGSVIATKLASKYPNKLIIVVEKNQKYKIHARYEEGKIHVGELLKKCSKGLGKGGGHRESAGASVDKINIFRKRLIKEIKRFSK